jgi:holo-[acyl-carrier protein] synthase
MIHGIGNDLIEIKRIKKLLKGDRRDAFLHRILTTKEMEHVACHEKRVYEYVAGRFSAKEAVAKAIGTGIGAKLSFQDIEIFADALGKPHVQVADGVWARCGFTHPARMRVHVTISHSEDYATAMAVVEQM